MYVHDLAILADANRINVALPPLHKELFDAQREAERSLAASRRSFEQAAEAASFMVEAFDHPTLAGRLDHAKHLTNDAIGHRQDAFIALGIAIDTQAKINELLGIHPDEDED